MEQIEVSIKLSMSGATFQEQQQKSVPVAAPAMPPSSQKVIPQQQQPFFSQSTTPNDLMEVSNTSTCGLPFTCRPASTDFEIRREF